MKVFEKEINGMGKTRTVFATNRKELDLIHGMIITTLESFPKSIGLQEQRNRLIGMRRRIGKFLEK